MSHLAKDMTPDVTWKDITPGCNIYEGGTSSVVETGDWRTMKPVIDWDKCRQCLLWGRNNGNQRKTFRQ